MRKIISYRDVDFKWAPVLACLWSLPGVVEFAVDVILLDEARRLHLERVTAHAAAQTVEVPRPPVHVQQVAVGDDTTASETHVAFRLRHNNERLTSQHRPSDVTIPTAWRHNTNCLTSQHRLRDVTSSINGRHIMHIIVLSFYISSCFFLTYK